MDWNENFGKFINPVPTVRVRSWSDIKSEIAQDASEKQNGDRMIETDFKFPGFKYGSKDNPLFDTSISINDFTPEMFYKGIKMLEDGYKKEIDESKSNITANIQKDESKKAEK